MDTSILTTKRLILRKFTEMDLVPIYEIFSHEEVNRFLPWFPLKTPEDAALFYKERFENKYRQGRSYQYAVCLKEDNYPIGYIHAETDDSHDFGYGLRKEFWHNGIITEAGRAVIEQLKREGVPYITATHDVNNPRSGEVMRRLGMRYQYSYEEQWQPKDFLVVFRMYQLNLDEKPCEVYKKYWDNSAVHFVETDM